MRKEYEMSKEQLDRILEACRPVPAIMLQCGMPESPQASANRAWTELGKEMGFEPMSVRPTSKGDRFFTAEPKETP